MVDVFWLEQNDSDVPTGEGWLSPWEIACLDRMRFAPRRESWRLGRWTAKLAVATLLEMPLRPASLASIEIRPAESGAPEVFFGNRPGPVAISISHRGGTALCMVAPFGTQLGCDLEVIEPHTETFIEDYFTVEERELIALAPHEDRAWLVALLWSAKESALKALRFGLRLDTRSVVVDLEDAVPSRRQYLFSQARVTNDWRPLRVCHADGEIFHGHWQRTETLVRTTVASPSPASSPISLLADYPSRRVSVCP